MPFTLTEIITAAVMLLGLGGLAIVIVPGLTIIWLAALVYGLVTAFNWWIFGIITVIMLIGNFTDNVVMGATARQKGASWLAIILALLVGVVGSIFFPPFGGLIGALLCLFGVEFIRLKDWRKALESSKSMAIGCGLAAFLRFGMGIIMIGLWVLWVFLAAG
ncbi:MAG TPA: DUF456 domain-containing protein [Longilinea sp.]|nr:DUF456 domain-containing protein [Longilinea sp.]